MRTELGTPLPKNKNDKHPENTYLYVVQEVFLDYLLGNAFETYPLENRYNSSVNASEQESPSVTNIDQLHRHLDRVWQSPWRLGRDKESHDNGRARLSHS